MNVYADWQRQLDAFQEQEKAYSKEIEELGKYVPLLDSVNGTFPALYEGILPALARLLAAMDSLKKTTAKLEAGSKFSVEDHAAIARFVVERARFQHMYLSLKKEYEHATATLSGLSLEKAS
jgi:hypothetical protein